MLNENLVSHSYSTENYEITLPEYPCDMQWSLVPEENLYNTQLYYCTYRINEQIVTPKVTAWRLENESHSLYLASLVIYQTPCLPASTTKKWFPIVLSFLEQQEGYLSDFVVLQESEKEIGNAKAHCFHAEMKVAQTPMYHLGFVTVVNGYLYEMYFVTKSDFFFCWKHTFEAIAKTFTINLKRHSFPPFGV
jgi:hypothetical protein